MNTGVKGFTNDSVTFFKSIVRIDFSPITEVNDNEWWHRPVRKKGDVEYSRSIFTGFRKRVKKIHTEDLWCEDNNFFKYLTVEEYAKRHKLLAVNGKLCHKAIVKIETTNKNNNRCIDFDTNEEALSYIRTLKEKCELCENSLL